MKVPAKGKAVQYGSGCISYSMGSIDEDGKLLICFTNKCDIVVDRVGNWQEVEITPVVHVPEEGKMVLCWNCDDRPKEPAIRRSSGVLCDGKLSIYDYVTPKGVKFGVSTAWYWEEI